MVDFHKHLKINKMAKKKKSSFKGKVKGDGARKSSGGGSKYLLLPKGVDQYSPTPGKTEKIDIIPYTITDKAHPDRHEESETAMPGDIWYKRPFKLHKEVGADNEKCVCPTTVGKKCPICEFAKNLADEGADWDEIKAFKPKDRILYAVIPRGVKKRDEEIHIMDFSYHLFQDLLSQEVNENDEFEDFPDIEDGKTLKVRWKEKEFGKFTYAEAERIDFEERDEEIDSDIIDEVPNLDEVLDILSYADLKSKFLETSADSDDEPSEKKEKKENPFKKEKKDKKGKSKKKEEPEELTYEDLAEMNIAEMVDVIEAKDLDIDSDDYDGIKDLRIAVAEELDIEVPKTKKKSKKIKSKGVESDDLPF